jgi:hypothetical protein
MRLANHGAGFVGQLDQQKWPSDNPLLFDLVGREALDGIQLSRFLGCLHTFPARFESMAGDKVPLAKAPVPKHISSNPTEIEGPGLARNTAEWSESGILYIYRTHWAAHEVASETKGPL